jgi:hypothetical protein
MTRRRLLFAPLIAHPVLRAQKKAAANKGPEVEVINATAAVEDNRLNIDGQVRNAGDRPIRKLTVFYEVLDSDGNALTRQSGQIEGAELLQAGEDSSFHAQMAYHARAVSFRLSFEDGSGRELRAVKSGPFPID